MIIFVFLLIFLGFYLLFLMSEKQKKNTAHSRFKKLLQHLKLARYAAYTCFIAGFFLSMWIYGSSIGWVSWWIFASPIIFMIILTNNRLKAP